MSWIAAKYGEAAGKLIYKYFNLVTLLLALLVIVYLFFF